MLATNREFGITDFLTFKLEMTSEEMRSIRRVLVAGIEHLKESDPNSWDRQKAKDFICGEQAVAMLAELQAGAKRAEQPIAV